MKIMIVINDRFNTEGTRGRQVKRDQWFHALSTLLSEGSLLKYTDSVVYEETPLPHQIVTVKLKGDKE